MIAQEYLIGKDMLIALDIMNAQDIMIAQDIMNAQENIIALGMIIEKIGKDRMHAQEIKSVKFNPV